MRLEGDELQRDLARAVRAGLGPPGEAGELLDPDQVHACLADLDLFALELPDSASGLAMGLTYAVPVCEELGRRAAPDAYRSGVLLADLVQSPEAVAPEPRSPAVDDLLPLLAAGKATAGLAAGAGVTATPTAAGWELHGDCALPQPPPGAAFHLVPAHHAGTRVLAAVAAGSPGLTGAATRRDGVGELRLRQVTAYAVSAPLLDRDGVPSPLLIRARIRQAAYLLGLAAGAHRLALARVAARRQFGRAIGENQAVAFPLAEQYAHLEAVRLLVHEAAWQSDTDRPAAVGATQSLAYAAELALRVTALAVHLHGAAGITTASAVQHYYRAAAVEAARWGAPTSLWQEAGALRLR
ncbi:acyl-CoA dehydrogenase family protein [Streptomyces sp. SPB162]|uniref:acyl-CoA dehydrogenase family protein n=1 Tax=Streptomyces sp. SPB162 TaxID=2940560 RepID=UPI002404F55E|nr:acyl-CoA dehydrogenase family protein [Streptomyces sp. SPB162]MDF9815301.1 alkylation response protein AidB-like acyl-CoA dehydrogenase [Streptomyces sp. SPB162]